jgi:hypothetical protein
MHEPDKRNDRLAHPEAGLRLSRGILASAIVFMLGIFVAYVVMTTFFRFEANDLGVIGDFFGGSLNPLLSFLSLVAILATIQLQIIELTATRQELEGSRRAQELQAQNLGQQIETLRDRERIDLTFRMLDRWISLRQSRLLAWNHIHERIDGDYAHGIDLWRIKGQKREVSEALSDVSQFLSDLYKLIKSNRLDPELAYALFADSVYPWYGFVARFRATENSATIGLIAPWNEITYGSGIEEWYREKVAGLKPWFEARGEWPKAANAEE